MQQITNFTPRTLKDYQDIADNSCLQDIQSMSSQIKDAKIYEINSTATGGGVAELLHAQMPLYQSLGLDVSWLVLPPNENFFNITKNLHNCLQGKCAPPSELEFDEYKNHLAMVVKDIPQDGDLYVLHDPQTIGLAPLLKGKHLIWRCHIDLTQADVDILAWVQSYYHYFEKVIFSMSEYAQGIEPAKAAIIAPSIDPLSEKNKPKSQTEITKQLSKYHIDPDQPYLLQVSRFDKFKDPKGVLEIFTRARKLLPTLNCVLAGDYAPDDPEGQPYYNEVRKLAHVIDPNNIQLLLNIDDDAVNALQRVAAIVVQNSNKEGFGLTVTEALWKQKIVFSRSVGGIALQVIDGNTGFILDDDNQKSAQHIVEVIQNQPKYASIIKNAKELVRNKFILPVMLADYLRVYAKVLRDNL